MLKKLKEVCKVAIATVTAVGLSGGFLLGVNTWTLQAATSYQSYLPPAVEYVSIPDIVVPEDDHVLSLMLTNVSYDIPIPTAAMSIEEAALVGAQYILDVFGKDIDGMYVELSFSDAHHLTRSLWFGVVSDVYRNTIYRNQRAAEVNQEIRDRLAAGECMDTIGHEWRAALDVNQYIFGEFYFAIDAITGERIEMTRNTSANRNWTREDAVVLEEYLYREWQGDRDRMNVRDVDPVIISDLSLIAWEYAQKHFINTTVISITYNGVSSSLFVENGAVVHAEYLMYYVIDDTGRVATITICSTSRDLVSISTSRNDIVLLESNASEHWVAIEHELEDGSTEIRRVPETNNDTNETTRRRGLIINVN